MYYRNRRGVPFDQEVPQTACTERLVGTAGLLITLTFSNVLTHEHSPVPFGVPPQPLL